MKFYCDSCNTKYSIADEKVRGKVLKVRCKKCEEIITVREARTPEAATATESGTNGVPQANWYYAVNGVTSGPFDLPVVKEKFATGEVGDEAYVWHDTFDEWKPVGTVDLFAESLAAGQSLKPRSKTLGFTGKLEAVTSPQKGANAERKGTVPRPSDRSKPDEQKEAAEPAPAKLTAPDPTSEAEKPSTAKAEDPSDEKDIRADKLAALRARLKAKKAGESKPVASLPERKPVTAKSSADDEEPAAETIRSKAKDLASLDLAAPDDATKDAEPADSAADATPAPAAKEEPKAESEQTPSLPTPSLPETPSTTSTSDIFEVPAPVDDDVLDDDDAVPFFPAAAAAPAPTEQSALTGSLLIQLDQIQKKGRGSKILALAAIVLILLVVGAVATYIAMQPPAEEGTFAEASGPGSGEHRELNLRRYSDDEQMKILELGEEAIEPMEFDAEEETESTKKETKPKVVEKAPEPAKKEPAEVARKVPDARPSDDGEKTEAESTKEVAVAAANIKSTNDDGSPSAEATRRKAELFRSATSVKREETAIARPEDRLTGGGKSNAKLSREQALEGMKRVSRSVSLCRERHMRRGGSFDTQKIFVTVTVNGDGRVTDFKTEPNSLQNTEFARCMNSHKGRWRFAAFGGEPQPVRRRFIIQ